MTVKVIRDNVKAIKTGDKNVKFGVDYHHIKFERKWSKCVNTKTSLKEFF